MKESTLRKFVLLLLVVVSVSLLWAIGANSRKRVELSKSTALESKLQELILANTAIVNDLKAARNRLASLQRSERLLKKDLAIATEKNEAMEKAIKKATTSALGTNKSIEELANEAEVLKNTNIALGEEILNLKEKDEALKIEIQRLKSQLGQGTRDNKSSKKKAQQGSDGKARNFTWE
jgi:predicted  nucleic acid-binding Zn-ribbon protein